MASTPCTPPRDKLRQLALISNITAHRGSIALIYMAIEQFTRRGVDKDSVTFELYRNRAGHAGTIAPVESWCRVGSCIQRRIEHRIVLRGQDGVDYLLRLRHVRDQ